MGEQYNIKVISYPNGSTEIVKYSAPVGGSRRRQKNREEIEADRVLRSFSETEAERQSRAERSAALSMSRTRRRVWELGRSFRRIEFFLTFTFDGSKIDRSDFSRCMSVVRRWLEGQKRKNAPDLQYLVVPELHHDKKNWHCHAIVANIGGIRLEDSGRVAVGKKSVPRSPVYEGFPTIYNLSGFRWGFTTAIPVSGEPSRIVTYICKYLTKDLCAITKGRHRYYASNNLEKPIVGRLLVPAGQVDDKVDRLISDLDLSVNHESHSSTDYVDMTYFDCVLTP